MGVLLFFHVIAACVWVGGLIVMGALVPAVRTASDDRTVVQAMARRFGSVSWIALGLLVLSGVGMIMITLDWSGLLNVKLTLVLMATVLALWHTISGPNQSPRFRGIIQATILVLSLVIVGLGLAI